MNRFPHEKLAEIARQHLRIILDTRGSDRLDFHDVSVWSVKAALQAAYECGRKASLITKGDCNMIRTVYLPAIGKRVSLAAYIRAVKLALANPDRTFSHGLTCWWSCTGAEIVDEFRQGMHEMP